ncbi:hypothetical protein FRB94_007811 [Tulasnella sp. JGI-2019a]|nr:hypothetical protein FRB93_007361 [Tulasnella sp. JGI-2019a]KAG8997204.1 hypothetical protein FRB94_007811 [Tulasnella sp. JGI-2019a]
MDMCRKLLDDVKKGIKRGVGRLKSEEATSRGDVLRKPSAAAELASETKAATAQANWEDVWRLDIDRLDSRFQTNEDTKGDGRLVEPYVWTPSPQSQRHFRDVSSRTAEHDPNLDTTSSLRRSHSSQSPQRSGSSRRDANHQGLQRSDSEHLEEKRPWPTLKELEGNPYRCYPKIDDHFWHNHQDQASSEEVGGDQRRQDRPEGRSQRPARSERITNAPQEGGDRKDSGKDTLDRTPFPTGERSMDREQESGRYGHRKSLRDDESYAQLDPVEASVRDEGESMRADSSSHVTATMPSGLPEWEMPSESDTSFNPWVHGQDIISQQEPAESTVSRGEAHLTDSSIGGLSRRSVSAIVPDRQQLYDVAETDESKDDLTPKREVPAKPQRRGAEQSIDPEKELPALPPEDDMDDWGHPISAKKRKRASVRLLRGDLFPASRDHPTNSGTAVKRGFFGRPLGRFRHRDSV